MKTNYEHLLELGIWKMANAIWNYTDDYCTYCPKNRERRCNGDCRAGVREWLHAPCIPTSDIRKERNWK